MQIFELQGELRTDLGKKATNLLRAEGKVPCVLYGGKENVHFSVVEKDLQKLLYTPVVYIVKVNVAGQSFEAVMRESQFHPVSDRVLHMDFYQISEDKPVVMEVPAAILIVLGFFTRPLAVLFVFYTLGTAVIGHHYWDMTGDAVVPNMINFYKNVSIAGAFILLAIVGPGAISLDRR